MEIKPLEELIQSLEQELIRLGYKKESLTFYKNRWNLLKSFAEEKGEIYFSEKLGIDFVEEKFHVLEKDFYGTLTKSEVQTLRVIRMLGDFQLHHSILRRYYKHKILLNQLYFIEINERFNAYCIDKNYSKVTIDHYVKQTTRFLAYAESQEIKSCKEITIKTIHYYIKTLAGYTYKTVEQNLCSLRAFFRFVFTFEEISEDYSLKIPMIQTRKQTRIPSVWDTEDLKKLISSIDRGSPLGKRDYAIILLACRLGLRCSDIKNLKMNNFHWEDKKLVFIQSKTKTILSLPLTTDVGWAVINYLKYGRPKTESCSIFVRHVAPFFPFSEGDHLHQIIDKYIKIAHISIAKKKRGMHSLRHTLASLLLENDTQLATISDILGHIDPESTAVYLKVDIKKLKECPLELVETLL